MWICNSVSFRLIFWLSTLSNAAVCNASRMLTNWWVFFCIPPCPACTTLIQNMYFMLRRIRETMTSAGSVKAERTFWWNVINALAPSIRNATFRTLKMQFASELWSKQEIEVWQKCHLRIVVYRESRIEDVDEYLISDLYSSVASE